MECSDNNAKTPSLSKAEIRVIELLTRGYSEKEIADKLNLSPHTVNNHMKNIKERNGLTKNTEIIPMYIAYIKHKKFSLKSLREYGLSIVMISVNICQYTKIDL